LSSPERTGARVLADFLVEQQWRPVGQAGDDTGIRRIDGDSV
jgi:hypothetical protein